MEPSRRFPVNGDEGEKAKQVLDRIREATSGPESMEEYLDGLRERAIYFRQEAEDQQRHADLSLRVAELAEKQLRLEECEFVFGLKGQKAKKMKRIREKIDGNVEPAQVIDAALTHLEWKVDREAEGLKVFAGEEIEGDSEEAEPWNP